MNKNLNIIDLISEKHIVLRREVEDRWAESEEEYISHTEALLLAKINMGKISIAEIARQANVTRQAMFKCAKKLEDRGYLAFVTNEQGSKYTELTLKGRDYCKRSEKLKESLEEKIAEVIGKDQVEMVKELLNKNWLE